MDKTTMHKTALWIQERADKMRDDIKEDYQFMGKNHDPNSYGTGFDKGYLEALQDISEEIWLRMNDEDIKP